MKKKTSFIIDRSKWRCGGPGLSQGYNKAQRGIGSTLMRNEKGYMCCLGQIARQLGSEHTLNRSTPENCPDLDSPLLTHASHSGFLIDNGFSELAMHINDDTNLTDTQRERKLERLAEEYGLRIEFAGEYVYPEFEETNNA